MCAARAPVAILNDNAGRPPPVGLAACWHRLSVYDRGTRFQIKRGASYVDVPHVGLGSRAFAVHPLVIPVAVALGTLVAVAAAWWPAREAVLVEPLAAPALQVEPLLELY